MAAQQAGRRRGAVGWRLHMSPAHAGGATQRTRLLPRPAHSRQTQTAVVFLAPAPEERRRGISTSLYRYIAIRSISKQNRSTFQWRNELEEIMEVASVDSELWVSMLSEILKTLPSTGNLRCDLVDVTFRVYDRFSRRFAQHASVVRIGRSKTCVRRYGHRVEATSQ